MSVRRPVCFTSLAYALGIAGAYIFSVPVKIFIIAGVSCSLGIFIAFIKHRRVAAQHGAGRCGVVRHGAGRRGVGLLFSSGSPRAGAICFAALTAGAFVLGGIYCAYELGRVDPLARYAVSPYNNVDVSDGAGSESDVAGGDEGAESEVPGGVEGAAGGDEGALDAASGEGMPVQKGRVLKVREKDEGYRSLTVSTGGRNVLVNVPGEWVKPIDIIGREIRFSGRAELPSGRRNPGTFDYALYLKTQGIRVIIKSEPSDIKIPDPKPRDFIWDSYGALCRLKYTFLSRAREAMTDEGYGLLAGMVFGSSSEMDEDTYDLFRRNGVAHILSVSGLHVMIVYAFFTMLSGKRRTLPVYLCVAAALICYAAMSEFSPSVVRAVTMIVLHLVSRIFGMRYDLLTGTCSAAAFMLIAEPLDLLSVGFRLSFLAVLLLAFAMPLADRYLGYRDRQTGKKLSPQEMEPRRAQGFCDVLLRKAVKLLMPMFVIQLGMMPVIAYEFNYVSLTGLLANPPVVALAGWVLPVGICMLLMSVLPPLPAIFGFAARGEDVMTGMMAEIVRIADAIPHGHFNAVSPPAPLLFVFYGLLFFLMSESRILLFARCGAGRVLTVCACIAVAVSVSFASPLCRQDRSSLVFVDVGQGDCLHIRTSDGRNYLVDGGGSVDYDVGRKTLLPYLLKNGVDRLDGVFATHLHTDHWRGLCGLSRYMDVGKVYVYEGNRVREDEIRMSTGDADEENDGVKGAYFGGEAAAEGGGGNRYADGIDGMKIRADRGRMVFVAQGDRVVLGEGVNLEVLWPPRRSEAEYVSAAEDEAAGRGDENKNSLIMKIDYGGVSAMMTGDAGEEAERALLDEYGTGASAQTPSSPPLFHNQTNAQSSLYARILKVGHHGSKYSTTDDFLAAVRPDAAVIQAGRNNFGHPTMDVLDKLRGDGIMIFRNDLDGAVMFTVRDGKVVRIENCGTRFQDN